LKHGDSKSTIKKFENTIRLFKEYYKLRVVDNILYRTTEDTNGFIRTQFVLPKQITDEAINKFIHQYIVLILVERK
jgi:hypothetical protein